MERENHYEEFVKLVVLAFYERTLSKGIRERSPAIESAIRIIRANNLQLGEALYRIYQDALRLSGKQEALTAR